MKLWRWLFGKKSSNQQTPAPEEMVFTTTSVATRRTPPAATAPYPVPGPSTMPASLEVSRATNPVPGNGLPSLVTFSPLNRQIRVFISSTFRDMHVERDHLVTVIFPQLRRLCEARGVTWGEIDLRWGIPDEAAAEGKVLPICLEEINRCRPYFIGLLGERYGCVAQGIPDDLLEQEPWLREAFREHKSVTELEMLHGALNDPAMAGHAYFYLRDPAYLDSLPEEDRQEFRSASAEDEDRLNRLKERIRKSGLPVRDNYADPTALGELVLADLTAVIDQRFPEGSLPDPLNREALDHAAYARSRERVYISRPDDLSRLDAHAAAHDDRPLVILGESGSGKSALLANWASRYRKQHPEVLILEHYIGATPASADCAAMLRRILSEFKQRLGVTKEIPDQPDALLSAFANWLHMAAAKGRIVLILDGLNQLEDRHGAGDLLWLPLVVPDNLRLIVSTLPGKALDAISERHWPNLRVELLSIAERQELIREFLRTYGRSLSQARVERIAQASQSANPLYLRVLLDELRIFGHHEQLDERIGYYLQAASPDQLYGKVIARWEADYGSGTTLVGDTLSLLWAARYGLSETELLDALGKNGHPLPRATWSPLFLAMSDAFVSRGGLLTFAHEFLRNAICQAHLPAEPHQQQAHLRLADYFEHQPPGSRRIDELPWQLAEAGAWQRLYDLLAEREFLKEALAHDPFEFKTYWTQVEIGSSLRMVDAYREEVDHPERQGDKAFLSILSHLLADTGNVQEALCLRAAAVEHYRGRGELERLQMSLSDLAVLFYQRGDLDGALSLVKQAEEISQQMANSDSLGLALSLGTKALILNKRGDPEGAMALFGEQERICRELGNGGALCLCLGNQALLLHDRGRLDEAMSLYKEVERISRETGNSDMLQSALGNQALICKDRGDTEGAMALLKEQERICRQLGNPRSLSIALGNQGEILQNLGKLDEAMALHQERERICRQLGDEDGLQSSFGDQAVVQGKRGNLDEAMSLLKEQERICHQMGNLGSLSVSLGNQAVILAMREEVAGALALLREQERLCRQLSKVDGLILSLNNQAGILAGVGRFDEARGLAEEARHLANRRGYGALAVSQPNIGTRESRKTGGSEQMDPVTDDSWPSIAQELKRQAFDLASRGPSPHPPATALFQKTGKPKVAVTVTVDLHEGRFSLLHVGLSVRRGDDIPPNLVREITEPIDGHAPYAYKSPSGVVHCRWPVPWSDRATHEYLRGSGLSVIEDRGDWFE